MPLNQIRFVIGNAMTRNTHPTDELIAQIEEILHRGVDEVIDYNDLKQRLLSGEKMRVKLGTDPTSPNIHLGRAVPLRKLRDIQLLGHQIILIIGDFTGEVGDTSDKESGRPMLTLEQVQENMRTYAEQCGKILDLEKTEVHYNSVWLEKLSFGDACRLSDLFSVAEFTGRTIIRGRLDAGKRVSVRELLYPVMQGYDSVAISAGLELGGTDQRYNLLAGRIMQKHFNQKPQNILMTNLINGPDGRKMSSSWGNTINIHDSAIDMFGKIMSMVDSEIVTYYVHCTRIPMNEVQVFERQLTEDSVNPRDIKLKLAYEITKDIHGYEAANTARDHFEQVIQRKNLPSDIPEMEVTSYHIVDVLCQTGLASSRSDARRLLESRGVRVDGATIDAVDFTVPKGALINKGKRIFIRIK
jgi:tyrosyl-tRNA synthetase